MRVLPVVDLMGGLVVRGVGGRRDEYRPIRSLLCDQPTPDAVGQSFRRLGLSEAYLADLDAIGGADPAWPVYRTLIECGLSLWVDAGLTSVAGARRLAEFSHQGQSLAAVVAGSESLADRGALADMVSAVEGRLVFSLDLRGGVPLVADRAWRHCPPEDIASQVYQMGVRRFIVLDLSGVGMDRGVPTAALCRQLRRLDSSLEIVSGGGVRGHEDLLSLAAAGCNAALVASALHDGRLCAADLF